MKHMAASNSNTYEAVESAIDLSKEARGTWEELLRKTRVTPWVNKTDPKTSDERPTPTENQPGSQP